MGPKGGVPTSDRPPQGHAGRWPQRQSWQRGHWGSVDGTHTGQPPNPTCQEGQVTPLLLDYLKAQDSLLLGLRPQ